MNRRLLVPALLVPLLLAGCAGTDTDDDDPDVAAPATAAPATPAPATAAPGIPEPTPDVQVIEVAYEGGQITGVEQRVEVPLGGNVLLRVSSDVAEEIHVHGYDLYIDVPAGGTGEVAFTADLPGAYEVELHDAGRPMFQLRVA